MNLEKSLTFGLDYKIEDKSDIEKFLEIKLATNLRDTEKVK